MVPQNKASAATKTGLVSLILLFLLDPPRLDGILSLWNRIRWRAIVSRIPTNIDGTVARRRPAASLTWFASASGESFLAIAEIPPPHHMKREDCVHRRHAELMAPFSALQEDHVSGVRCKPLYRSALLPKRDAYFRTGGRLLMVPSLLLDRLSNLRFLDEAQNSPAARAQRQIELTFDRLDIRLFLFLIHKNRSCGLTDI